MRLLLCYDHYLCRTTIDVYMPPPQGTRANPRQPMSADVDVEGLGQKHRPSCPVCGQIMKFVAWNVEQSEDAK